MLRVHLALRSLETFTHDFGVAATARAFLFIVHLHKLAAKRYHLIGYFCASIVGAHDSAQAGSGADGGQAGHASTRNENLGWRHLACGSDLSVKEATKGTCSFDHSAVTADTRHGGQGVHFLGAAECPRQCIDGQRCDFMGRELLHQVGVLSGPQETDQRLAFVHQGHFFIRGGTDLEDDVAAAPKRGSVGRNGGAGLDIGFVREVCQFTRTLFHHHGKAELGQFGHHIGYGGDAFFTEKNLPWHADALRDWRGNAF